MNDVLNDKLPEDKWIRFVCEDVHIKDVYYFLIFIL